MKKYLFIFMIFIGMMITMSNSGCDNKPTTDAKMSVTQETLYAEALREVGFPATPNHTQLKELKMIYELCDKNNLINYFYLKNEFTGKMIYIGKCLGYGIPYATQYSNPLRVAHSGETPYQGNITLPQPEPDFTFKPADARGTWVLMFDDNNQPQVTYWEPDVIVLPFKLPDYLCQK
jgi:hypothetical protein